MNKLYSKLFVVVLLSFAFGGCKVDAPIYPEGTVPSAEFLAGNGGQGSVSNGSSIIYSIDGKSNTLKPAFFQVIAPSADIPSGNTQIGGGTNAATAFSLSASTSVAGTFDADIISLGTSIGQGKVTFTEISTTGNGLKGTVKGSFTGKVTDFSTMAEKDISGSFSIKM